MSCVIKRIDQDSSNSISVVGVTSFEIENYREISVELRLYSDLGFSSEYTDGAVVEVGKAVWGRVQLIDKIEDPNLRLQVHTCFVEIEDRKFSHKIIENSCPTDPTIEIITIRNLEIMLFKFETFKFAGYDSTALFVTCEAILCNKVNDPNPLCSENGKCKLQHYTRKKREENALSTAHLAGQTVFVRKGPIIYKLPSGVTEEDLVLINGVYYYKGVDYEAVDLEAESKENSASLPIPGTGLLLFVIYFLAINCFFL